MMDEEYPGSSAKFMCCDIGWDSAIECVPEDNQWEPWEIDTVHNRRPDAIGFMEKEKIMNIRADFEGKIKRIGSQFLLQLGCQEYICQDLKAVGKMIETVLAAEYKKLVTSEEPPAMT
jgi:hypothetical protein